MAVRDNRLISLLISTRHFGVNFLGLNFAKTILITFEKDSIYKLAFSH